MRFVRLLLVSFIAAACADAPSDTSLAAADPAGVDGNARSGPFPPAAAVTEALRSLPSEGLWPSFSPSSVPVALFDGERTILIAHPAPPADFTVVEGEAGVYEYPGRHAAVRGNMPTEIGGVRVAAVLLNEMRGLTADRAAAVIAHERFHVHQLEHHPDRTVNELARFQYPTADAQQLFDRRLETMALYRSVSSATPAQAECWLRTALILRRKRMSDLPPAVAAYERGIELQEGLARYIERRAAGIRTPVRIAAEGYAPEDVRGRAYVTGEALAVMLDRYSPGWKDAIENAERAPALDSLLWVALLSRPETSCGFSAAERAAVLERAVAAVDAMRTERETTLHALESRPGWRLRVISEGQPLWPQSFDPMSIARVSSATLVHERMLRAGNERGYIDVFGRSALSTGYLEDPLGSGMREVRVTGLPEKPVTTMVEDGRIRITAPGVDAMFGAAHLSENGQEIVVRVR